MKSTIQRILATVLCIVMMIGFLPFGAIVPIAKAEGADTSGEPESGVPFTETPDEFDRLREKWAEFLLPSDYDLGDTKVAAIVADYSQKAGYYWTHMNKAANGTFSEEFNLAYNGPDETSIHQLWNGAGGLGGLGGAAAGYEVYYDYLYAMAFAFAAEGSEYYQNAELLNDIIFGMDFMDEYLFTATPKWRVSNWWERTIGMPKAVNNIVTLLWDHLPAANRDKYIAKVKSYAYLLDGATAQYIAANRIDECLIAIVNGILAKDGVQINTAVNNIITTNSGVLKSATSGNGVYYDGSYLEHSSVAYTSSYGLALIEGISQIVYLVGDADTEAYRPPATLLHKLDTVLETTFLPHVFRGNRLASTSGRSVSRQTQNVDGEISSRYTALLLLISEGYPTERANYYKGIAKTYLQENQSIISGNASITNHLSFINLLENTAIPAVGELKGVFTFNRMARTTVKRNDYLIDIAMHSNRIADNEYGNKENYRGFHTGDGVMYLYNSDNSHYQENFWATVDYKRLPGTTVDTQPIEKVSTGPVGGTAARTNSKIEWAGASKLGDFAAVGFMLNKSNITEAESTTRKLGDPTTVMDLKAAKSWFIFDNEIVALGSGITSGTDRAVETTIENRKITGHNPSFYVNGELKIAALDSSETVSNANWAWLEGNVSGSEIGYYFGGNTTVNVLRETRSESWLEVNESKFTVDATPVSDDYVTMYIDHGTDPSGASYEYAVLPGFSKAQVEEYSANPQYTVLSNTADLHAVYHKGLGITALNNYASEARAAGGVTVSSEGSVMLRAYPEDHSDASLAGTIHLAVNRILTSGSVVVTLEKNVFGRLIKASTEPSSDGNVTVGRDKNGNTTMTVEHDPARPQDTFTVVLEAAPQTPVVPPVTQPATPPVLSAEDVIESTDNGNAVVSLPTDSASFDKGAQEKLTQLNAAMPIVVSGKEITVLVPAGTLSGNTDFNGMMVDPSKSKEGSVIKVTRSDGTVGYLPLMAAGNGTVSYVASVEGNYELVDNSKTFADQNEVPAWAGDAVGFVSSRELFLGNGLGEFDGESPMSRNMIATVLGRLAGVVPDADASTAFSDLPQGHWAAPYAAWGSELGILQGMGEGRFHGDASVTREQLCVVLDRFVTALDLKLPNVLNDGEAGQSFEDLGQVNDWAKDAMYRMIELGIIQGKSGSQLAPQSSASRYELAVILERFVEAVLSAI